MLPRNGMAASASHHQTVPFRQSCARLLSLRRASLQRPTGPDWTATGSQRGAAGLQVLAKGSPEAVRTPSHGTRWLRDTYMQHASSGKRSRSCHKTNFKWYHRGKCSINEAR